MKYQEGEPDRNHGCTRINTDGGQVTPGASRSGRYAALREAAWQFDDEY